MLDLLKVDSLEEAIEKLYNECKNDYYSVDIEEVDVKESFNRILAEEVVSKVNVPEFDRSVVDGYAVIAKDTEGANDSIPTFLKIVGESYMGEPCDLNISNGECVYVPTGAMLPKCANACVMIEHTENITTDKVAIYESVAEGKYVVKKGDDIKKDEIVLKRGHIIKAADMGFLSSVAVNKIKVYKKPNITIISTGDELINNDENNTLGKVRDVNTNLLIGLSNKYNLNVVNEYLLKDDEKLVSQTLENSMKNSDVVLMSGGSSKGKKDVSSLVIDKLTSKGVLTHGIAIKPGKPTITGYDSKTKTIVVGLPGHPVAAALLYKFVVINTLYKLMNVDEILYTCEGTMNENIPSSPGRMTIQLVKIDDKYNVSPVYGRSGLIHTLSEANGFIKLEINQEGINKGEKVKVYYL